MVVLYARSAHDWEHARALSRQTSNGSRQFVMAPSEADDTWRAYFPITPER